MSKNIAIIRGGFLGLTLVLLLAENSAVCKCGQLFHKFDETGDHKGSPLQCVCGLQYEIEYRNVREL